MRTSILLAGAALMLAACGKDDQSGQAGNVEQGLTAEAIVANDVTAIDAVTADAANMAADVDINFTNEQMLTDENPASNAQTPAEPAKTAAKPKVVRPPTSPAPASEPAATPEANSTE